MKKNVANILVYLKGLKPENILNMATLSIENKTKKLARQVKEEKSEKKALKSELYNLKRQLQTRENRCKNQKIEILRLKQERKIQGKELKTVKNNLLKYKELGLSMDKPFLHKYPMWLIRLAIVLQISSGLSYRQVQSVLKRMCCIMCITTSIPCPNTIRQWGHKYGKSVLEKGVANEQSKILIIDESIGMGQEKAFLILAIESENWAKNPKSLTHEDTVVVGLQTKKNWKGAQVSEQLKQVRGNIKYIVSDNGSVLKKACELADIARVPDCTHYMGNLLKKYSEKSPAVQTLLAKISKIRQQWGQTEYAPLITPNLRTKGKFLNMFEIAEWVEKILTIWDNFDTKQQGKIFFVKEDEKSMKELVCMVNIIKDLSKNLKNKGVTAQTITEVQDIFSQQSNNYPAIEKLKEDMMSYIEKIRALLPKESCILCCSDVIESYFGKFKNRNEKRASKGIAQDILITSLFGAEFCIHSIKDAMESTSWADVTDWHKENLVASMGETKCNFWKEKNSKIAQKKTVVCTA